MNSNNEKTDFISSKMEELGKETVVIEPKKEKVLTPSDSFLGKQIMSFRDLVQKHSLIWVLVLIAIFGGLRALQAYLWKLWFGSIEFHETWMFALFLLVTIIIVSVVLVGGGVFLLAQTSLDYLGWQRKKIGKTILFGLIGFQLLSMNTFAWGFIGGSRELPELFLPSITRFLMVVIFGFALPAWVEEVLFRGYLQPILVKKTKKLWIAIILQAVIFTVAHIGWFTSWTGFASAFIAGLILGLLRGRNRSLLAPFLAHGLLWTMIAFSPLVI